MNRRTNRTLFIGDIILVFVDGEVSHRYSTLSSRFQSVSEYIVGFGGSDITGELTNIKLYNAQASTNEIYSMYSGSPLAPYRIRPECECPRHYSDTFNFIGGDQNQFDCVDPYQNSTSRFGTGTPPGAISNGKLSIFNSNGWLSDYTDDAKITISFNRPMLIYAISGVFLTMPIMRPAKMEIKVISTNPAVKGAVSYLSNDCLEDYGIDPYNYNAVFGEKTSIFSLKRKKRAAVQTNITPKCFNWDDVLVALNRGFDIPILTPTDVGEYLNDAYSSTQLYIHLIGHTSLLSAAAYEDWYSIKELQIYGRPHCGGNPYQLLPGPAVNMSNYYQFTKQRYKFYECTCPPGISGDQCEQCTNSTEVFRYTKRLGVCANCDCSDLSISKQCDAFTGQCPCEGAVDVELAGRQCHWYINEIDPQYGPKAGGTTITFSGEYFGKGDLVVKINGVIQKLDVKCGNEGTLNSSRYLGNATSSTVTVGFTATLTNSTVDLGPQTLYYSFEYRSNPIIEDIYPRTTILSGGTNLTVVGEHLDSVVYPEMVVYLTQQGVPIGQLFTRCDVIESDEMVCKVVDLSISIPYLNGDKQALPANNVSFPVSSSSTTSSPTTAPCVQTVAINNTANALNGQENVQFTLGFIFDGHTLYTDLRQNADSDLRDLATLYVYQDPVIEEFKESIGNEVLEYRAGDLIHIDGDKLDYATTLSDYIVIIGVDGVCEVTNLVLNRLSCRPPSTSPDYHPNNSVTYKNRTIPHIEVKVGNKRVKVGYVFYKTNIWLTNQTFRISMIVLMVVVGVALIAVLISFLVRKFKLKERLHNTFKLNAENSRGHARYAEQDFETAILNSKKPIKHAAPDCTARLTKAYQHTN
ncbi:PLXNB3 [Bugula neritina]|uniref:PLXNB3 n=1 Tax=Bugula neritina TaxID=10212 RepID=A0A7J7KQB6_BUGNE|nr:PLXNB3 [Bugula neritina]